MESNQIGTAGQEGTQAILNGILGATGGLRVNQRPAGPGRGQTKLKVKGQRGGDYAAG
jgi:hypothetical protein